MLASFTVICFADIKRYKFTYQFAFPVIHPDVPWILDSDSIPRSEDSITQAEPLGHIENLSSLETTALVDCVQTWRYGVDARQHGFFLARKIKVRKHERRRYSGRASVATESGLQPTSPDTPSFSLGFKWAISSLSDFEDFFAGVATEDQYVGFVDPSTYPSYPGWMLRNLLVLIQKRWKLDKVQILCYRDIQARRDDARSIIIRLRKGPFSRDQLGGSEQFHKTQEMPKVTGWERNGAGKVTSKVANLGEYMDPQRYVSIFIASSQVISR